MSLRSLLKVLAGKLIDVELPFRSPKCSIMLLLGRLIRHACKQHSISHTTLTL